MCCVVRELWTCFSCRLCPPGGGCLHVLCLDGAASSAAECVWRNSVPTATRPRPGEPPAWVGVASCCSSPPSPPHPPPPFSPPQTGDCTAEVQRQCVVAVQHLMGDGGHLIESSVLYDT